MDKTIMVVDDDPTMISFLGPIFNKENYGIIGADNGKEALKKIKTYSPDMIISDIMMPEMDGFELYRRLRMDPDTADIPFVFLSSKKDPADQLRGLRMGAVEYLTKPFDVKNLFTTIKNVLANVDQATCSKERIDFGGNLIEIDLENIVQILEMSEKTGELVFTKYDEKRIGSAYFKNGEMIYAVSEKLEGEEAFYDLAANRFVNVQFYSKEVTAPQKISRSIMQMMIESSRFQDESQVLYKAIDDLDEPLVLKTHDISDEIAESIGLDWLSKIAKLIEQKQSVREIINSGVMSRLRAEAVLGTLISFQLLELDDKTEELIRNIPGKMSIPVDEELVRRLREIEVSKLTGLLEISGSCVKSKIQINKGKIDQAYHGDASGKKALFRIFADKGTGFDFRPRDIIVENTISATTDVLLVEGKNEIKWKRNLSDKYRDAQIIIMPKAAEEVAKNSEHAELTVILNALEKQRTVRHLLEALPQTDYEIHHHLVHLKNLGLINIEIEDEAYFTPATEKILTVTNTQIVIDSSADLPDDIRNHPNITIIPFNIQLGTKVFSDGIDISNERFLELTETQNRIPRTYSATGDDIHSVFKEMVSEKDILGIFMSGKLSSPKSISGVLTSQETSSMYENAVETIKNHYESYSALRMGTFAYADAPIIEIIDSRQVSMGTGLLVMEALEKIKKRWAISKIRHHIDRLIPKMRVLLLVNAPKYLGKAWPIGINKASAESYTPSKNPIIGIQNGSGELELLEQIKPGKDGIEQFEQLIRNDLLRYYGPPIKAAVMHSNSPQWAEKMGTSINKHFDCTSLSTSKISSVVGANCGTDIVGVAYFPMD